MAASLVNKVVGAALLAAMATVLSGCYTYEVQMSYRCTQPPVAPNTQCMAWEQLGGVKTPTTCFPGSATVTTRHGSKAMSDLALGDEILGVDHASGEVVFSPVRAWIHREVSTETAMSAVGTKEGVLVASPRHNLATKGGSRYVFAGELQAGDALLRADGTSVAVNSVTETMGQGLYAPLTWTSNFFVGGPEMRASVLAHSFAELRHPMWYEGALHKLLSFVELFVPRFNDIAEKDEAYIHPVARFFGYRTIEKSQVVV